MHTLMHIVHIQSYVHISRNSALRPSSAASYIDTEEHESSKSMCPTCHVANPE